jgi:hypothetical protein
MFQDLLGGRAAKSAFFPAGSADESEGAASVIEWKARKVILDVDAPAAAPLTLLHFYYAGWSARIAQTGEAIPIGPSSPDGLMKLNVPQGRDEIVVELSTQPTEKVGRLISLLSLACLLLIVIFLRMKAPVPSLPD